MTETTSSSTAPGGRLLRRAMAMPDIDQSRELMDRGWCVSRLGRGWYCRGTMTLWWAEALAAR